MNSNYKELDLFAFENFVIKNKDNYQAIIDKINDPNVSEYEKAQMAFYIAFNLEDDESDKDEKVRIANDILFGLINTEDSAALSLNLLSSYFVALYEAGSFDNLANANFRSIKNWVFKIWEAYNFLEGLKEEDFPHLRYQFVFDYETDRLWQLVKSFYKKIEDIPAGGKYNQHPLNFLCSKPDPELFNCLANQIHSYFKNQNGE